MRQMNPETMGAFLNNYFPHLFVNMDKLTDADIAKIFGRLKHLSTKNRTIRGTLKEIRKIIRYLNESLNFINKEYTHPYIYIYI